MSNKMRAAATLTLVAWLVCPGQTPAPKPVSLQCAACHPKQARDHAKTLMARTMERGDVAKSLVAHRDLSFQAGPYRWRIVREGDRFVYSVTDGTQSIKLPILWAMGEGTAGQTFILQHEGKMLESRVSYYSRLKGLDITIGAPPGAPPNFGDAIGRVMTPGDVVACFNCHSVAAPAEAGKPKPTSGSPEWADHRIAGVQCEHCHAGSERHAEARSKGDLQTGRMPSFKDVTAEEMSDLCGKCHRTWGDIQVNGPRGVANVRFQPYRIARSKCYDAVDQRIGCIACHDPHDRHESNRAAQDKVCTSCHSVGAKLDRPLRICKTAKDKCTSCHMPKTEIPGSHFTFVDHNIRIVRAGEKYPD